MSENSIGLLKANMAYLNQRQKVIAEDVANVNTPNYKAHDLKEFKFSDELKKEMNAGISKTNSKHLGVDSSSNYKFKKIDDNSGELSPNGNNVSIEGKMFQLSKNNADYQLVTNIYKKMLSMLRRAVTTN